MDANFLFLDDDYDLFDFGDPGDYTDSLASPSSTGSDIENHIIYDSHSNSLHPSSQHDPNQNLLYRPPQHNGGDKSSIKKVYQRKAANLRERRRMKSINEAFETLRTCIPNDAHADRRMSKVDTLRLAMRYISFLSGLVQSCSDLDSPGVGPGQKGQRMQEKVIVRCNFADQGGFHGDDQTLLGHSLSWDDPLNRHHQPHAGSKLVAKIWMPENPTESDLINLASYSSDY